MLSSVSHLQQSALGIMTHDTQCADAGADVARLLYDSQIVSGGYPGML